jgi:hypothetical protein
VQGNSRYRFGVNGCMVRSLGILALALVSQAASEPLRYLPTIQERWAASDLVCIGTATAPALTGAVRRIGDRDRDQLASDVELERCFNGAIPVDSSVRVIGYDFIASKDSGFAYAGPPTGFVSQGRNVLFLRRTGNPQEYEIAVPVYETAIRLSDARPDYTESKNLTFGYVLTRELEAALVHFDDSHAIELIFNLLGERAAIAELSEFSRTAPVSVERDCRRSASARSTRQ